MTISDTKHQHKLVDIYSGSRTERISLKQR